jgi:hypothetical protein
MVAVVAIFLDVRYILWDDNICQRVFSWIDVFEKAEPIVEKAKPRVVDSRFSILEYSPPPFISENMNKAL